MKVLCLDQATQKSGYSIWLDKELIRYGVLEVDSEEKNIIERMKLMRDLVVKLIQCEQPNFIVLEDTFSSRNKITFKQLCQLQGVLMGFLFDIEVNFIFVSPTEWKAYAKIKGRKREEQKLNTIKFVLDKFGWNCSEDESDAIGIGYWSVNKIKSKNKSEKTKEEVIKDMLQKHAKTMQKLADS